MDVLIIRLTESLYGCQLQGVYFGCLLYADDIMILSHSFGAMRYMLKICDDVADEYDVKFSTNKSVAMRIGNRSTHALLSRLRDIKLHACAE